LLAKKRLQFPQLGPFGAVVRLWISFVVSRFGQAGAINVGF